jgi:hypothetical protein
MQGQKVNFRCLRCKRVWSGRFWAPGTPDNTAEVHCTFCERCKVLGEYLFRRKFIMQGPFGSFKLH